MTKFIIDEEIEKNENFKLIIDYLKKINELYCKSTNKKINKNHILVNNGSNDDLKFYFKKRFFSKRQKLALKLLSGNKCCNCGLKIQNSFHADHIKPFIKGGRTTLSNGQALCKKCNLKKGSKYE